MHTRSAGSGPESMGWKDSCTPGSLSIRIKPPEAPQCSGPVEARVCKHARPLPVSGCALQAAQSEVPSSRAGPTSAAGRLTGCHVQALQGAGPLGAGPKPPFRLVLRFNFQVMAVPDPAEAAGARAKKSCGWATHPSGSVPTGPALGPPGGRALGPAGGRLGGPPARRWQPLFCNLRLPAFMCTARG
jgi:hypothetical protein